MGDGLTIRGGITGVTARFDDMLLHARLLDEVARDFGEIALTLGRVNLSGDIAEAAVLCPVEVAHAEEALLAANIGPHGAAIAGTRAEASAAYLRFSVGAYQEVDELMARAGQAVSFAGGFVAGCAVPLVAAAAVASPVTDLAIWMERDKVMKGADDFLYDHPWLQEVVTRSAPGAVEGLASEAAGGNGVLLALMSGGHWPTMDFQGAVRGLLAFASRVPAPHLLLQDSGTFTATPSGAPDESVSLDRRHFVAQVLTHQLTLSKLTSAIQIITVRGANGPAYIVQMPGTQDWGVTRTSNPVDLSTNVSLAAAHRTRMVDAVVEAMRTAHIPSDAPVMLTGHSQGGIVAASMAADPRCRAEFNIKSVITAGSPIAHVEIPRDISVLSLEERQDAVPKLDGASNPDRPNWVTVTRDLTSGSASNPGRGLGPAHALPNYRDTAAAVDSSADKAIDAWREGSLEFLGPASKQVFAVSPMSRR